MSPKLTRKPTTKHKRQPGAKKKLAKLNITQIKQLIAKNFTDAQIAEFYNISVTTYWKYRQKNKKALFLANKAKKAYKERVLSYAEIGLEQRVQGCSVPDTKVFMVKGADGTIKPVKIATKKHYPPDVGAIETVLFNCDPKNWRRRTDVNIGGQQYDNPNANPVKVEVTNKIPASKILDMLTTDQIRALMEQKDGKDV